MATGLASALHWRLCGVSRRRCHPPPLHLACVRNLAGR